MRWIQSSSIGFALLMVATVAFGLDSRPVQSSAADSSSQQEARDPLLVTDGGHPALRFAVAHGHHFGFCLGYLYISKEGIRYEEVTPASDHDHSFEAPRSAIDFVGQWKPTFGIGPENWAVFKLHDGKNYSFMHVLPRNVETGNGAREDALPYQDIVNTYQDFDGVLARVRAREAKNAPPPPPPSISIVDPAHVAEGNILPTIGATLHLHGIAAQSSGIASVSVNGQNVPLKQLTPQTAEFDTALPSIKPGINPIQVVAVATDKSKAELDFKAQRPQIEILSPAGNGKTTEPVVQITGQIRNFPDISRVELAGIPATTRNLDPGVVEFTVKDAPLSLGPNTLAGFVVSTTGKREEFTVAINRDEPPAPPPLKLQEVLDALQKQVPGIRIQFLVTKYGVDFEFTGDIEKRLRAAGADDALLLDIAKSYRAPQTKDQKQN